MLFTPKWSLLSDMGHESHECLYAFKSDVHADAAPRIAEMPVGLMILPCGTGPSSSWGLSLGVVWADGLNLGVGVSSDVGRAWGPWGDTGPSSSRVPFFLSGMCTLFSLAQWLAA